MADLLLKKDTTIAERIRAGEGGSALFYVSVTLFFLVMASYGGLFFLNRAQDRARQEIISQVRTKEEGLEPGLLNQIFLLDKRIKNMQDLLTKHVFSSNVFTVLENDTHPQVRYSNLALNTDEHKVDLSAETASYAVLARQIAFLESDPQIERVDFGGLSLGANSLLGFKLAIVFKQALLQIRP